MMGFGGMVSFELDGTVDDVLEGLDRVTSTGAAAEPAVARV